MTATHCRQQFCVFLYRQSLSTPSAPPSLLLCFGCSQNLLVIWLFISHLSHLISYILFTWKRFCSSPHRVSWNGNWQNAECKSSFSWSYLHSRKQEVLKILERGKRTHFTYFLGSAPSLLLVCWQQLDKLVTSLILRKRWHSYIKRLLKRSKIFKADVIYRCELVEMSWHETYLAYGAFTCSTRKILNVAR